MKVQILKSKIHRVKVTDANLDYIGSITIDERLMKAANILEGEKIQVVNNNNGERFETYCIPAPPGSGEIALNGAAAHKGKAGDLLVIITFIQLDPEEASAWDPRLVIIEDNNTSFKMLTSQIKD